MRKITILGTGHIGLANIVHETQSLKKTGVEVIIVENEKNEQRPFHKDESLNGLPLVADYEAETFNNNKT